MSTEWYIQSFSGGEEQPVPVKKVMSAFSGCRTHKSEDYIDIALPDGDVTFYMDCTSDELSFIMISRPADSRFLDRIIYDIMLSGNFILYSPDGDFPVALSPQTAAQLPEDMLKSLGEPRTAENAESFSQLLKEMYGQQC